MENVITQEQLENLKARRPINGVVLLKGYSVQPTKTGGEFLSGTIQSGVEVPIKAWSNSVAFAKLKQADYKGMPVYISGTIDDYNNVISILLDNIQEVNGVAVEQFLPVVYNEDAYWEALKNKVAENVSEKGFKFCKEILFENEELAGRFRVEFAAKSHHDNCKNGLLAHTYKVFTNMISVISKYPGLVTKESDEATSDYKDLLYIGCLFHDIGKTVEMNLGIYQPESIVTHRYLGVEFIAPFKDDFIKTYNEDWYYQLISIMLQHHGQWGDPCRTVSAYLVNKVDELDASLTLLASKMNAVDNVTGQIVKLDDTYLTI